MTKAALRSARVDWYDGFDRSDGILGRDWISGHTLAPARFEPIGLDGAGAAVITNPRSRSGEYEPEQAVELNPHPPPDGLIYTAIGWAGRECPADWVPDVEVTWSGLWDTPSGHHIEATPLLWIDPTHPAGGFGAWPSTYLSSSTESGIPVWLVGFIGSPPELFAEPAAPVIATQAFSHADGTPRRIRIRHVPGDGTVEVLLDGVVQVAVPDDGEPMASLRASSTLHGFAVDAHHCRPIAAVPTIPAITGIRYRGL